MGIRALVHTDCDPPTPQGVHCESPCKSGTYGKNCSLECSCKNFVDCSPIDGACFCKEGKAFPFPHIQSMNHEICHHHSHFFSCLQAGEGPNARFLAWRETGAADATVPVSAPTGRNVTPRTDPALARPAGRGRTVTSRAR